MSDVEMEYSEWKIRHDLFQRQVSAFIERYVPRGYEGRDFEHELRSIIQAAYDEARRPFIYELQAVRDAAITQEEAKVG